MYSITSLSKLSGVSTRTLRYYESEGMLSSTRDDVSGYRNYDDKAVDRLQHILILRALGLSIKEIKTILVQDVNEVKLLESHLEALKAEASRIDNLILTVKKTIDSKLRGERMADQEKFEAFKKAQITENEKQYGKEAREKYGDDAVDASNEKYMGLSKEDFEKVESISEEIKNLIIRGVTEGDADGSIGKSLTQRHKAWLMYFWKTYSSEAHKGLADMYLYDERFKAYYDAYIENGAEFIVNAIKKYA